MSIFSDQLFTRLSCKNCLLYTLFFLSSCSFLTAQGLGEYLGDESLLYAETKQVNQFFRRFNCEESAKGKRYYPGDKFYRHPEMRVKYLQASFDKENLSLDKSLKEKFITFVNGEAPKFLDFHGGEWFAEVQTQFSYKGKDETITLFLKLEEAKVGSKWVFTHAIFEPFQQVFSDVGNSESSNNRPAFIHPLSHELDFVELIKVFRNKENLQQYAKAGYQPDYLTLLLYEIKKGNLAFKTVESVKFHFFQIDGWYFELREFQRRSPNRGWLISQLVEIPKGQKELLLQYIYQK